MALSDIREDTGLVRAGAIVQKIFMPGLSELNGVYGVTDTGRQAHQDYADVIAKIRNADK